MGSFTPARLTVARMRRGLRQQELADRCGVDARTIRAWEKGEWEPEEESLAQLARALRFPASFFAAAPRELIEGASFRSLTTMTAGLRDASLAAGTLVLDVDAWIHARFRRPDSDVPDLGNLTPSDAARRLRAAWNLGDGPAPNMVHLLEAHGVRVYSLPEPDRRFNAFSFWENGTPFVLLNTTMSGERGRFDCAHELGHLVLHRGDDRTSPEREREANEFAASFLLPAEPFLQLTPAHLSIEAILALKKHWQVSLTAMVHRLAELERLSQWRYRELMIDIGRRGWRTSEPYGMKRESSQVLAKVFGSLRREEDKPSNVARAVHLPVEELQRLIFGLVAVEPVPDPKALGQPMPPPRKVAPPKLRVIRGALDAPKRS